MQSIPTEKIQKKPIPDEHLVLKTTFEGLIQKCLAVATDPVSPASLSPLNGASTCKCLIRAGLIFSQQTKRKLDDANKRLEVLYDKLREQTVSQSTIKMATMICDEFPMTLFAVLPRSSLLPSSEDCTT